MQENPIPTPTEVSAGPPPGRLNRTLPYEAIVRLIGRNRCLLAALLVLSAAGGWIYLQIAAPQYTSSAKLCVETTSPKVLKEGEPAKTAKNYLYTQASVVHSAAVLDQVVQQIRQAEDAGAAKQLLEKANPVQYLEQHLSAGVGKRDDLLVITFTSDSPTESAEMAGRVVEAYIRYTESKVRNTSGQVLSILQHEKERTDRELMEKLRALTEYKKEHKEILFGNPQENLLTDQLARLSEALTQSQLNVLEAQAHYKTIQGMTSDPDQMRQYVQSRRLEEPDLGGISESTLLRNKLHSLQLQREKLLRMLTPEHPSVGAMEDKIATTLQQIEELGKEYAQAQQSLAFQQYTAAVQKQEQLAAHYEQQRKIALDVNEKLSECFLLESDWQQTKKMCDLLDERIREVDISENTGALNIHVLEQARVPDHPSSPDPKRVMAVSFLLAAAAGLGLSLARDLMDDRFCCDSEIQSVLGAPVLGVIVRIPGSFKPELISYTHPDSAAAQAYRKLCTFVFLGQTQDVRRVFHVCSGREGAGKTATVCNLGIAMAKAAQRTLLMDCNFTHPRLNDIFGLTGTAGLSEVIQNQCALPETIEQTFIPRLDVLSCGRLSGNLITLFNHPKFRSIIQILRCQYDRILIDSRSILEFPESLVLSHYADACLLTLHGERDPQREAVEICRQHEAVGSIVIGAVVTQVLARGSCYQHRQTWLAGKTFTRILDALDPGDYEDTTDSVNQFQKV